MDEAELRRALEQAAARDIELTLKVAVLLALELGRPAIAKTLGVTAGEVRAAVRQLREVAPYLGRGSPGDD